jgi:hypothetical protein
MTRTTENVVVKAIIIMELKFRNVKVQLSLLTLWKGPTMPRLKALHRPSIVLVCTLPPPLITTWMVDGGMRIALAEADSAITPRLRWLTDLPVVSMCRGYHR